jgi:hypothetical protein
MNDLVNIYILQRGDRNKRSSSVVFIAYTPG